MCNGNSAECAVEIFETKKKYILKMKKKLEDPNTAPKMYLNIPKPFGLQKKYPCDSTITC